MLRCPELGKLSGVTHGFFTRKGGVSQGIYASLNCGFGSGDDIEAVAKNRKTVTDALQLPAESLCTAYQIHSAKSITLNQPWHWQAAQEADALVSNTPGVALGILTADCLPILMADSKHRVIAAVHAGWKGAIGGVMESAIETMTTLGASRMEIVATIGPAIAQHSYEVGAEFRDRFVEADANNGGFFAPSKRKNHFLFNLGAYAKQRLTAAGITAINMLAHDTCLEENDFFSYRRACLRSEIKYGRQISVIALT